MLRALKAKGTISSFVEERQDSNVEESYKEFFTEAAKSATPSYEYYYEAAQEDVPGYKVELAKSGRSQCVRCKPAPEGRGGTKRTRSTTDIPLLLENDDQGGGTDLVTQEVAAKKQFIPKGDIRVGSLDSKSGLYSRWNHLVGICMIAVGVDVFLFLSRLSRTS